MNFNLCISSIFLFTIAFDKNQIIAPLKALPKRTGHFYANFMNRRLKLSFQCVFLLLISFRAFSQNNMRTQPDRRSIDSIYRLQQAQQTLRIQGNKNDKPLFSFTPATAKTVLARQFNKTAAAETKTGCIDTSGRFFLNQDSAQIYIGAYIRTQDGNLLLSGEHVDFRGQQFISKGFLMKCDENGNVFWTKLYDSVNHIKYSYLYYYRVLELQDGSILLGGSTPNQVTQNTDIVFTKTNNAGDIIWSKVYKSRLWGRGSGSTDYFYIQQMIQDAGSGNIFFTGPHWSEGRNVTNLDANNGKVIWSNLYQMSYGGYFDNPFGLDIQNNDLLVFGRFVTSYENYISVYRLNKMTGDTIQSKFFQIINDEKGYKAILHTDPLVRLTNGNYIISGAQYHYYRNSYDIADTLPLNHAGIIQFNQNIDFVNAFSVRNNARSNLSNTKVSIFPDGSGLFTMLNYISGYTANVYFVQFKNDIITKQRIRYYSNGGIPNEMQSLPLNDGGTLGIRLLGDSSDNSSKLEFLKLHVSDSSSKCLGIEDYSTFFSPFSLKGVRGYIDSIGTHDIIENPNKTITSENITVDYSPGCKKESFCDSLSIKTSKRQICVTDPVLLTVHKNPECGAPVFFDFGISGQPNIKQVNDSVYSLKFDTPWKGAIRASTYGCTLLLDSVEISVLPSASLNLGTDTVLCPGNSIILNAGGNFVNYLWQDDSTDSVFIVKASGKYFVKVTNGCGSTFVDTVIVKDHPPIPFDVGPDLEKCNDESLTISAPEGFISYSWSPDYNMNSSTSGTVIVNPQVSTLYKVKAEKPPGCFVYDSINVVVHTSPIINLGIDKAFCFGDSAVLDAGAGFVKYVWNTGGQSQEIIVKEKGDYFIIATNPDGCQSSDTIKVTQVFINPVIKFNKESNLCSGTSRELDAGNFISFEWSTGEKTRTINVNNVGVYIVKITDINTCTATDTAKIIALLPLPNNFLPADTSLCSYSSIELYPNNSFSKYVWNTGAYTSKITATHTGVYWLQVTDNNNCTGKDSIVLRPKDCMAGFFIPNSFTPNGDGVNDIFKPLLFGSVVKFEFIIYNRFGEIIFKTNKLNDGWQGNYKGNPQDSNMFLWVCKYQFKDEAEKTEKGAVMLLR